MSSTFCSQFRKSISQILENFAPVTDKLQKNAARRWYDLCAWKGHGGGPSN
jgi:hypothetical protein